MSDVWWGIQYVTLVVASMAFGRPGAVGSVVGMVGFLVFDKLW